MVESVMSDIHLLLAHYMRSLVLLSLATFTAYSIFFTIMGVPFGVLLAVVAMALEFIPMIGPLTAASHHPVGHRDFRCVLLDCARLPGGIPHVPGLFPLAAPDGAGRTTASPAGSARGFRRRGSGRCGGISSVPVLAMARIVYVRTRRSRLSAPVTVQSDTPLLTR